MATIYQRLSKKVQQGTRLCEVLLTLKNGNDYFVRGKSGIFITPDNFKNGGIWVNRRKVGNDIEYHEKQLLKMQQLEAHILKKTNETQKVDIDSEWLRDVIHDFHHPKQHDDGKKCKKKLETLINEYLAVKTFSSGYRRSVNVVFRDILRFERYKQLTDNKRYTFNPGTVTHYDIEQLVAYLRNEPQLCAQNEELFKDILRIAPSGMCRGKNGIQQRGENTIIGLMKKVKAFFHWLNETERINNDPFKSVTFGTQHYGTPFYLTIEERNKIASYQFTSPYLKRQRDVFVFQCLVGCRVSDLIKLTTHNIIDGILVYAPHKTKDDGEQTLMARVPLHKQALKIIERYKSDDGDRLLPCTSQQKYNDAIKEILSIVGITRTVTVRNSLTGEPEQRPINEIASSHMARRTFVGNAYSIVKDPNLIGKMSGHVEGSKAFARYRKIEDEALRDVIKKL